MGSCHYMQEPEVHEDCSTLFGESQYIDGIYEGCPPFLDYDSSIQEDFFNYSFTSPYNEDDVYSANTNYDEGENLPWNNWRNWCSDDDLCFGLGRCWDDSSFSYNNGGQENWHESGFKKTEEQLLNELQGDSYVSNSESAAQWLSSDDNLKWSGYEWFGCAREEDSLYFGKQDTSYADSYAIELCQAILGNWPCLMNIH